MYVQTNLYFYDVINVKTYKKVGDLMFMPVK